jgi:hypothetical protein
MCFAKAYDNALHHQQDQKPKGSSNGTSFYQTSVSYQPNKRKREIDQSVHVQRPSRLETVVHATLSKGFRGVAVHHIGSRGQGSLGRAAPNWVQQSKRSP